MSNETIVGLNAFTEQPIKRTYAFGTGWKTVRTWEGPQDLAADKEAEILVMTPAPESISTTFGVPAIIEATFPALLSNQSAIGDEEETNAVWELIGQDMEKPLAVHGFYNISGSTAKAIEDVDTRIRKGTSDTVDWDTLYAGYNMQSYRNHKMRGIDTYTTFSYIVRKTITSSVYSLTQIEQTVARLQPGHIISWNAISVPSGAKFKQPQVHTYENGWKDKPLEEWLVKAPSVRWQKKSKTWEMSQEWWGAEKWSSALYELGTYVP